MVSIIKNQLLKHLSIYTKDLSSDKINLSTFRGEGELSNLQLNEAVLTELLELPNWLRLTSAWCNHVSFRISWTKLKSVPITLTLDEVNITVETCEPSTRQSDANGVNGSLPQLPQVPQGKYSFIHKVVDGITIIVNTVNVRFLSPAFTASVQMSRIRVESKTPKWLNDDLRMTRLKDAQKGIILIFKELSWQTVRIEASSTQDSYLTPLRLLTNQARCRITIRKRLSDCSLLASRLVLILDDLLWVLTDSQLKAALHFVDSLTGLIKKATAATQKTKAAKKLETLPEYQAQIAQQKKGQSETATTTAAQRMFNAFDVRETSYHFFSQRIDLHLCDDEGDGRSNYPELDKGGALQISIQAFQVDFYPYHLAKSDRAHWAKYKESSVTPALWLKDSLNAFRESVLNLSQPQRPTAHAPLERSTPVSPITLNPLTLQMGNNVSPNQQQPQSQQQLKSPDKIALNNLAKLMSSCVVLRIEDFTLYRVTTSGKKQMPKEFIAGDKDRYSLPTDMPLVHAEFTYFYYPGDFIFPLPPSKAFVHVNPLQVHFDLCSLLWFNSFALNLHESLLRTSVGSPMSAGGTRSSISSIESVEPNLMYMDIKLEAIMPRIVIDSVVDAPHQKDRPKCMEIQIARLALTNIRETGSSRADLAQALHSLQEGSLVFGSEFPAAEGDFCVVTERILAHVAASDVEQLSKSNSLTQLSRYAMWSEPRDVWCIKLDPVWVDFLGARSLGAHKSIPFVDAVPVTIWLHTTGELPQSDDSELGVSPYGQTKINYNNNITANTRAPNPFLNSGENSSQCAESVDSSGDAHSADLHAIAHIANLVSVQIDHYQLLFLLRLAEEFNELATFLSLDAQRILQKDNNKKSIIFGCVVPQVEVTLVMPSPTPGKESSGGDAESVLPDSASLADDLHLNSTNISWPTPPPPDQIRHNRVASVETPSPISHDPPYEIPMHTSNPNTHGYNVQIQSTPPAASSTATTDTGVYLQSASSTATVNTKSLRSARNSTSDVPSITKEINSGLMSMKKGFSSFMTSIDSAMKSSAPITDDISDTFSIQSDISSDSENYAIVIGDDKTTDCIDMMFRLNPFTTDNVKNSPVELASEACEEPLSKTNQSSPSEPSEASIYRRRDLVSMATFRLTTVELIRQNEGDKSTLRIQIAAVSCDECHAIPWDELQTKFNARCKAWNMGAYNPEATPCIRLRLEETLNPPSDMLPIIDKKCIKNWYTHKAEIRVSHIDLSLNMSTVIGLADLAEDEVITPSLPVEILLENLKIKLIEDRPPVNITSPGPVPINLNIGRMKLYRDSDGILNIQPMSDKNHDGSEENCGFYNGQTFGTQRDRELLSLQLVMQQLKIDNEHLRKQLVNAKENGETYRQKNRQENEMLRSYLKAAQNENSILLEEKRALMDTIRSLQTQLQTASMNSSRKSDNR